MNEFNEFLDHALAEGKGRKRDGSRKVPAFVPANQALFDQTIETLGRTRFHQLDVRGAGGYKQALNSLPLNWPRWTRTGQSPREMYVAPTEESESRLLIVVGEERMPRFWTHLCKSSALHIGAVFPPFMEPEDKCFVVPDSACVCVVVKESELSSIPDGCLDPVLRYTSLQSKWVG